MKIIVDAFGGDNAPLEIIKGCIEARKEFGVDIMLTGDRDKIEKCAKDNSLDISAFEIKHADTVFEMTTPPTEILKSKRGTSLGVGFDALASGEGDAFVSAGSTGAILVGGTLIVKRIKGVKRPALGAVMLQAQVRLYLSIQVQMLNVLPICSVNLQSSEAFIWRR